MNSAFKALSQHLNQIQVGRLTWPIQNFYFTSLEPFRSGLARVLRLIFLLQNPNALEFKATNWWVDILHRDFPSIMASCPGPETAKQSHTITQPPPCLTVWCSHCGMLLKLYSRCNRTNILQKVFFLWQHWFAPCNSPSFGREGSPLLQVFSICI